MPIDQLKRREFITLLGGAASAWATYTHAQQPAMRVIGVLGSTSADSLADILPGFSLSWLTTVINHTSLWFGE
jgi:hypothetical protein